MSRTAACKFSDLRRGDSVGFSPVDLTGAAISLGTYPPWPFSSRFCHFGMVAGFDGYSALYESTIDAGLGDCLHAKKIVAGVQVHGVLPRLMIHGARGGRAWRLPLLRTSREVWDLATDNEWEWPYRSLLGTGYDPWGALSARFLLGGWRKWLRERKPEAGAKSLLFCSEFVLLAYQKLGLLPQSVASEKYNPKAAARLLVKRGICGPPEEIVL